MTIALGVTCSDGILLASDREYSSAFTKSSGPKIFFGNPRESFSFAIAGSGDLPIIEMACEEIDNRFVEGMTWEQMKKVVKLVVIEMYKKHILPSNTRVNQNSTLYRFGDLYLIIGIRLKNGTFALIKTEKTAISSVNRAVCVGIGSELSNMFLRSFFAGILSITDAKYLAIYTVQAAKQYVIGCGKGTNILILRGDGGVETVTYREIKRTEKFFKKINTHQRTILTTLNPDWNDTHLNQCMNNLKQGFKTFRKDQAKNPIPHEILYEPKNKS